VHAGAVRVYSRSGYDWTRQFHRIAKAAEALVARELIIDGEATVLGKTGLPDFQALRRELAKKQSDRLTYFAFDLLYLDGYDRLPLIERKRALKDMLAQAPPTLDVAEYFDAGDGHAIYRHACRMGLEGIVSKRRDAPFAITCACAPLA
jgi:bifunctional non-homologous end joining protein LigD